MYWNEESKRLLQTYIDKWAERTRDLPSFFLLVGPENTWKSTLALVLIKNLLWEYFESDFLHIKDYSHILGKDHSIKVAIPDSKWEDYNTLMKEHGYQDIWVREINKRMSQSSMGKHKVVLIENFHRMTNQAMNAFLKTCEEPLPGKLIIATSSHQSQMLDTIISRSLLIKFGTLKDEDLKKICQENNLFMDDLKLQDFVCKIAMGKPWLLFRFDKIFSENEELRNAFLGIVKLLETKDSIWELYNLIAILNKNNFTAPFIDGIISYFAHHNDFTNSQKWLDIKKLSEVNVNIDNLMFSGII